MIHPPGFESDCANNSWHSIPVDMVLLFSYFEATQIAFKVSSTIHQPLSRDRCQTGLAEADDAAAAVGMRRMGGL
jgi:hypothetical protein